MSVLSPSNDDEMMRRIDSIKRFTISLFMLWQSCFFSHFSSLQWHNPSESIL